MVEVQGDFVSHVVANAGACGLAVFDADTERAKRGLIQALDAIAAIRHPEEPDDQLVSFVSPIGAVPGGGVGAWFDAGDVASFGLEGVIAAAITSGLDAVGVEGVLSGVAPGDITPLPTAEMHAEPWSGEGLPRWLPLPLDAKDARAVWVKGSGFVEYWTTLDTELTEFYRSELPRSGFSVTDESHDEYGQHYLAFEGLGRDCKLSAAFRRRTGSHGGEEIKVNVRCDLKQRNYAGFVTADLCRRICLREQLADQNVAALPRIHDGDGKGWGGAGSASGRSTMVMTSSPVTSSITVMTTISGVSLLARDMLAGPLGATGTPV